jgi:hypothetical protein
MSEWTDDPLAIAELLRDGQVERERLHALLLAIMRALPHGHEAPMDQWPQMIADQANALADRDATIARLREAQAWQPIETAPKDGTEVLAWRGGRRGIVRWHENSSYWDEWHRPTAHCRVEPTHWMPLPLTPAKEAD